MRVFQKTALNVAAVSLKRIWFSLQFSVSLIERSRSSISRCSSWSQAFDEVAAWKYETQSELRTPNYRNLKKADFWCLVFGLQWELEYQTHWNTQCFEVWFSYGPKIRWPPFGSVFQWLKNKMATIVFGFPMVWTTFGYPRLFKKLTGMLRQAFSRVWEDISLLHTMLPP